MSYTTREIRLHFAIVFINFFLECLRRRACGILCDIPTYTYCTSHISEFGNFPISPLHIVYQYILYTIQYTITKYWIHTFLILIITLKRNRLNRKRIGNKILWQKRKSKKNDDDVDDEKKLESQTEFGVEVWDSTWSSETNA